MAKSDIHETAVISPKAEIGEGVTIGPFACIEEDVTVGDGCVIGPHVTILRYTSLGARCEVHAGAVLGDTPQDTGFSGDETGLVIGADCKIREGVTIHRGTKPGTVTQIGQGCFLMGFSHFAHNVRVGNGAIIANGSMLAGYVEVGERAFISGNCAIHQFTRIGRLAMMGGGSGLSKDVPPFCTVRPVSFNTILGLNSVGMRRAGLTSEHRADIKKGFKILYNSGLNVKQAIERIEESFSSGPALEFRDFVRGSSRGICGFGDRS